MENTSDILATSPVSTPQQRARDVLAGPPLRVLVVDDSRGQRLLLASILRKQGFDVHEAETGDLALGLWKQAPFDIVLSDWMMPGLTGPELCRLIREQNHENYTYFILLTSKTESEDVAAGLDSGADEFLSKPVAPAELRARLRAGERLIEKDRLLVARNRQLQGAFEEIQRLYSALDSDLIEARNLQQSLVRNRDRHYGQAHVSLMLRPSGHVGGDLVGSFPIGAGAIGVFAIDVSGHGIASALLTARVAGFFSGTSAASNYGIDEVDGQPVPRDPAKVAADLNRIMVEEICVDHYFTMFYGHLSLADGTLTYVQAGHPNPLVCRKGARPQELDGSGLPVGLVADADFATKVLVLAPGDRLLVASDGLTEANNESGEELGDDGLKTLFGRRQDMRGTALLESLVWDLEDWAGQKDFYDDLSAVLIEIGETT